MILQGQKLGPVLVSVWSWLGFVGFVMTGKGMQGKAREVNKFFEEWPRQGFNTQGKARFEGSFW